MNGEIAVPWYTTALEPGVGREALRPVRGDEVEELDDDLSAFDLTAWWLRPDGHRAVATPGPPRPVSASAASLHVARRVGPAVKARRWRLGESQELYARRTRRAQSLVSVLERGRRPLSVTELIEIAVETGRTVRLDILPDASALDPATEHVTQTPLGASGVVRVAVGRAPDPTGDAPGVGYRLPYTIS